MAKRQRRNPFLLKNKPPRSTNREENEKRMRAFRARMEPYLQHFLRNNIKCIIYTPSGAITLQEYMAKRNQPPGGSPQANAQ